MDTLFNRQNRWNMQTIFKMNDLSPAVQAHVCNVFVALAMTIFMAAAGVLAFLNTHFCGQGLTTCVCFGLIFWLAFDSNKANQQKRLAMLAGFGFFKGVALGGLVEVVLEVDPSILVTAFLATCAIFLCFAGAAFTAKRRSYFYLQGMLSSALTVMLITSLAAWLFPSARWLSFNLSLYGGLAVFCGYVVLDCQLLVEKAVLGSRDVAWDALDLFIDFVAIFVRICIILLKNAEKKDKNKDKK